MLPSFETWSRLREDQGLSIARSKRVLKQAVRSMLGDDDPRNARQTDSESQLAGGVWPGASGAINEEVCNQRTVKHPCAPA